MIFQCGFFFFFSFSKSPYPLLTKSFRGHFSTFCYSPCSCKGARFFSSSAVTIVNVFALWFCPLSVARRSWSSHPSRWKAKHLEGRFFQERKAITSVGLGELDSSVNAHAVQSRVSAFQVENQGDNTVQCKVCMFVLPDSSALPDHMKVCTGIRNTTCNLCSRTYSSRCSLKEHLRGQHGIGKLFACQKCGKILKTNTRLYDHQCIV